MDKKFILFLLAGIIFAVASLELTVPLFLSRASTNMLIYWAVLASFLSGMLGWKFLAGYKNALRALWVGSLIGLCAQMLTLIFIILQEFFTKGPFTLHSIFSFLGALFFANVVALFFVGWASVCIGALTGLIIYFVSKKLQKNAFKFYAKDI